MWLSTLGHLVGVLTDIGPTGSAGLITGTATAALLLLAAVLAVRTLLVRALAEPLLRATPQALRAQSTRTGIPRHRDPNAAGRARPRAPSSAPAAV